MLSFSGIAYSQNTTEYVTDKNLERFATPNSSSITNTYNIDGNWVINLDENYSLSYIQTNAITNVVIQIINTNKNSSNVVFLYGDGNSISWPRNVTFHNDIIPYITPNTWNRLHVYGYKDRYVITKMGDNSEPPEFSELATMYFMVQDGEFVDVSSNAFELMHGYYDVSNDYIYNSTDCYFSNNIFRSTSGKVFGGWVYWANKNDRQYFMFGSANSSYSPVITAYKSLDMIYRTYASGWRGVYGFVSGWHHMVLVAGPSGTPFDVYIDGVRRYHTVSKVASWSNMSSPWLFSIGDHPSSGYNWQCGRVHTAYAFPYALPVEDWEWNESSIRELGNIHRPNGVSEL